MSPHKEERQQTLDSFHSEMTKQEVDPDEDDASGNTPRPKRIRRAGRMDEALAALRPNRKSSNVNRSNNIWCVFSYYNVFLLFYLWRISSITNRNNEAEPQNDETTPPSPGPNQAPPAPPPSTLASSAPNGSTQPGRVDEADNGNVDEDEVEAQTFGRLEHRFALPHRASKNNAAESYFKKSTSLVYHFLDIDKDSVVLGDFDSLERVTLLCGFCNRSGKGVGKAELKGWNVNVRARGSTTNFSNHMHNHHPRVWDEIVKLDSAAMNGGSVADSNSSGPMQQWLNEKVKSH
jgi:hypothetical protein